MDAILWFLLPGFVAIGSGLLMFFVMQSRMEVALAQEREAAAQARSDLEACKQSQEESLRAAEEAARRKALDQFLGEMRVEQRQYVRHHRLLFTNRKSLVMEERIFFRNLPLSNWIEREVLLEEGADVERVARRFSVFDSPLFDVTQGAPGRPLLS